MYLGKYFQGDRVPIYQRVWLETPAEISLPYDQSSPTISVINTNTGDVLIEEDLMAAYEFPFLPGLFRYALDLISGFESGNYCARVRYLSPIFGEGVVTTYHDFEIEPGGSPYGSVTAICEVARPDVRHLVTGSNQGYLQRRKNPRVPQ